MVLNRPDGTPHFFDRLLGLLAYLGLGEGAALYALANGSGSSLLLGLSAAAIASGCFAIGVPRMASAS